MNDYKELAGVGRSVTLARLFYGHFSSYLPHSILLKSIRHPHKH